MITIAGISAWFLSFWEWLRSCYTAALHILLKSLAVQFALISSVVYGLIRAFVKVSTSITSAMTASQGVVTASGGGGSPPGSVEPTVLQVANMFLPIVELWAWMHIIAAVIVGISLYRFIKSWIPTVSGG